MKVKTKENNEKIEIIKSVIPYKFLGGSKKKKLKNKNKYLNSCFNIECLIIFILFFIICLLIVILVKLFIMLNNKTNYNNNNIINDKLMSYNLTKINNSNINQSNSEIIVNTSNINQTIKNDSSEEIINQTSHDDSLTNVNNTLNEKNNQTKEDNSLKDTKNETEKNDSIKKDNDNEKELVFDDMSTSYKKAQDFLNLCIQGKLEKNFTLSENPKISVVIPVYNAQNYILRAVRSVQNQNMDEVEIILVNDYSTDKSLSCLEDLQKEDPRIKIIRNNKNMGTLYSRSIGVLSAKGEYIFSLDNDDMYLDYDLFNITYNIAKNNNYDIVEFKGIRIRSVSNLLYQHIENTFFSGHKPNLVLYQPELGNYPLYVSYEKNKLDIRANYLWNKCIKTQVYQKGLNQFGEERYKRYMTFHEDFIVVLILFNVAESFRFIGKYGYVNIVRWGSAGFQSKDLNILDMYLIDAIIDFSKDTFENKKNVPEFMLQLMNRDIMGSLNKSEDYKKLFISILKRIFSCQYISEEDKNKIKNNFSKFNFLNDTMFDTK